MTKEEKIDNLKNRISMALTDPILQQGFEIICKNLANLESKNEHMVNMYNEMVEKQASYQESLHKDLAERKKKIAELEKENAKAKDLLMNLSTCLEGHSNNNFEFELLKETAQFLKEEENDR